MKLFALLVLIGVVGIAVAAGTNYCSKSLCGDSDHIACNNTGDFVSSCPSDRKLGNITEEIITAILKKHNEYRNILANGKLEGFESSSKMATMKWDKELAKMAELNVKTCKFAHDKCHNTLKFSQSGQNLAMTMSTSPLDNLLEFVTSSIDSWWKENKDTTTEQMKKYPEISPEKQIGHFTAMARGPNYACGCATASYTTMLNGEKWFTSVIACDYATTNIVGYPTYTTGETASQCATGVNPNFKSLCSQ